MLAWRWIKLLTYFVIFLAKQQLMMHFIQNLSLLFHSFLDIYLHGSGSSVDNIRWYRISTTYWIENLHLYRHTKWYTKTLWPNGMKMLG